MTAAVSVVLAASVASAGRDLDPSRRSGSLASAIKTPVQVLTKVAVTQAKLEHDISSRILHAGVDLFTRSLRWLSHRGESEGKKPPAWDLRYW